MELDILDPRADARYELVLDLRYRVLREPLGMARCQVTIAGELDALHVVATEGGAVVGTVLFDFATGRLRAMAVDPSRQRAGIGARLVRRLEEALALRGVREVTLHARADVIGFYEHLGYAIRGAPFVEIGLQHRTMGKALGGA
jgi:GNAT superfamily N-acetyltransferase